MLASPAVVCNAISRKEYRQLSDVEEIDPAWSNNRDYIQLELWKYDPQPSAVYHAVDVISLFLSLRKDKNERGEQAMEEILSTLERLFAVFQE